MKHNFIHIITILFLLAFFSPAAATECSKSYLIQIGLSPSGATETVTQVVWGSAPVINSSAGELRGEVLAKDGSTIMAFWIWDPRLQIGDNVVMDKNGTARKSSGIKSRVATGDLVIQFPYSDTAASFRLSDTAMKPLVTIDLTKAKDGRYYNCTKEMYVSQKQKPPSNGSGMPADPLLIIGAGVLVLIIAAGAGWYFLGRKKQS